jgi:hypothetical protein
MNNPFKPGDRVVRVTLAGQMFLDKGMIVGSAWTVDQITSTGITLKDYHYGMDVNYQHFVHESVYNSPLSNALKEDK